jgi:small-conductance mechanosensitive channel
LQAQLEHERAQLEQAQRQRRVAEQRMQEGAGQQEELRQRLEQVQGQLEGERQQGREREEQVRRRVRELEEQNRALRLSWSWRITAPLRAVMQQLQAMAKAAPGKTRMLPSQGPDAPDAAVPPVWPTETMPPVPRHWSLANLPPHAKQLHQIIVSESHRRLPPEEQDRCAS